jgi:hypothetical protein
LPSAHGRAPIPWSIEQLIALVTPAHASVDAEPETIVVGLAVKMLMIGGAVTVTVAVFVALPPGPVAVSVYVVVATGLTLVLPLAHVMAPTPLLMAHVVALVMPLHASVDDPPRMNVGGVAPNDPTAGAVGATAVTVTVAVCIALPPGPVAVSV